MDRVDRFETLSPLLTAQLKRGVYTNNFLSRADYDREIGAGLYVHAFDGGLLLLRRRKTHDVMNFYLQPGAALELPALDRPVVAETVWRPRDEANAQSVLERLWEAGFHEQFRRSRRERAAAEPPEDAAADFPGPERAAEVLAFLERNFDPFTGCIPTMQETEALLSRGEAACRWDGQGLCGVLHMAPGRNSMEIRHLAVREDCRGRGLAEQLLRACLQKTGGVKSLVWARQGNVPAEHFYEKHGYRPDGWQSSVSMAGGKDKV